MERPCPICSSQNIKVQDDLLSVYGCARCGHAFTISLADNQESYNEDYYLERHKNWFKHPNKRLFSFIIDRLDLVNNPGAAVLDIGCGRGDFLQFALSNGVPVVLYGIDKSANSEPGIEFLRGDFCTYGFARQMDFAVGTMIAEHVENPTLFVKKIYDVLKPNGSVVLVTINSNGVIYRLARFLKNLGLRTSYDQLYNHHHLQHYTNRSLRRLMEENGFEVVLQRNHNFPIAALDLPKGSTLMRQIYRVVVAFLFAVSSLFSGGINQTIVCRKKSA